ncbi:hypothetical protein, partial [Halomonas getboli]|uniref:hypothetical protein n=1 Tax=Halomonas getboli TaxID=2935862 RepID=UPI001FFF390C
MKRMLLTTCLVAALGASVSTMAVAMEVPDTIPSAADRQVVGSDAVRQIDEAPLMLAVGDAWETRSQRVS